MPTLLTHFKCLGNSHKENISSQLSSAQCGVCRSTCSTKVHKVTARYSSGWINVYWLYRRASSDFYFLFFSFLYYLLQELQLLTLAFQIPIGTFPWLEGFWRNRKLHSHGKNLPITLKAYLLHPTDLRTKASRSHQELVYICNAATNVVQRKQTLLLSFLKEHCHLKNLWRESSNIGTSLVLQGPMSLVLWDICMENKSDYNFFCIHCFSSFSILQKMLIQ